MKNTLKLTHISILLLILLFGGCQKCKKEVKPDPCIGYKPFSADFKMTEMLKTYNTTQIVEVDTVLEGQLVNFEANQDLDSYEWKIGFDGRTWSEKKVSLRFFGQNNNYLNIPFTITVTLKGNRIRKEIDSICSPNIKVTEESITKKLVVMPYNLISNTITKPALLGEYEGFEVSKPNEKFIVKIKWADNAPSGRATPYFDNLNNGCKPLTTYPQYSNQYDSSIDTHYSSGTASYVGVHDNCNYLDDFVFFLNLKKDSLTVKYRSGVGVPLVLYEFKGKRIK